MPEDKYTDNIRYAIINAGITQERIAEELDVSRKTLWNWVNKRTNIPLEKAVLLADILHIPFDELIGRGMDEPSGNALISVIYDSLNDEGKQFLEEQAIMCKMNPRFRKVEKDDREEDGE